VKETETPGDGFDGEKLKLAERGCGFDESFQAVKGCNSQWLTSQYTNPWTSREMVPDETCPASM